MLLRAANVAHNALINGFAARIERRSAKFPTRGIPLDLVDDTRDNGSVRLSFVDGMGRMEGAILRGSRPVSWAIMF